jgi:hypothetical protein
MTAIDAASINIPITCGNRIYSDGRQEVKKSAILLTS